MERRITTTYSPDTFVSPAEAAKSACILCHRVPAAVSAHLHENCGSILCHACLPTKCPRCAGPGPFVLLPAGLRQKIDSLQIRCGTCCAPDVLGKTWTGPLVVFPVHAEVCERAAEAVGRYKRELNELAMELRNCKSGMASFLESKGVHVGTGESSSSLISRLETLRGLSLQKPTPTLKSAELHPPEESRDCHFVWNRLPPKIKPSVECEKTKADVQARWRTRCTLLMGTHSTHTVCRTPRSENSATIFSVVNGGMAKGLIVGNGVPHCYFWYDVVISYDIGQFLLRPIFESNYSHITEQTDLELLQVTSVGQCSHVCRLSPQPYGFCIYFRGYLYIHYAHTLSRIQPSNGTHLSLPSLNLSGKVVCAAGIFNDRTMIVCFANEGDSDVRVHALDLLDYDAGWMKMDKVSAGSVKICYSNSRKQQLFQLNPAAMGFLQDARSFGSNDCDCNTMKPKEKTVPQVRCVLCDLGLDIERENHHSTGVLYRHHRIQFVASYLKRYSIKYFA